MQFGSLDSYEPTIRQIVNSYGADTAMKYLALDQEDLQSELRFTSWEAQVDFRSQHKFSTPQERRFVCKSLWNSSRDWRRRGSFVRRFVDCDSPPPDFPIDEESRLEARDQLRRLAAALGQDFSVLKRVGEAGGVLRAYQPSDGTPDQFRWRVAKLRRRAASILGYPRKV